MAWVKDFEGMLDFLSLVIVHAPDDFPKEDYLHDDEQLNLENAFAELRLGMQFVIERVSNDKLQSQLVECLNASFESYKRGNDVKGAHLLQDFENMLLQISGSKGVNGKQGHV